MKGRRIFIEFDGVMANCDVWINGAHLGRRPYGYVSFSYDLTSNLSIGSGKADVLAVRADNSGQPASRWYSGAGIYRHVRLVVKDPVHFLQWGTFITTPRIAAAQATVRVQGTIANQSDKPCAVALQIKISSPNGKSERRAWRRPLVIAPGRMVDFQEELVISNPQRWQLDNPALYTASLVIRSGNAVLDSVVVRFGIRDARFVPQTGFWLNGKNVKG